MANFGNSRQWGTCTVYEILLIVCIPSPDYFEGFICLQRFYTT